MRNSTYFQRLAFVHIMRTAGTFVNGFLPRILGSDYEIRNSWNDGLERDWTKTEILAFSEFEGPLFVHNHVVSWDVESVETYKRAGFFLFTFVRDVGDQLCSLHFLLKKRNGIPDEMSLDEFIRIQISAGQVAGIDYRHWQIPPHWPALDYVAVFSEGAFRRFVSDTLGLSLQPGADWQANRNASQNLGYGHYCTTGEISPDTQRFVAESHFQRRFLAVRDGSPRPEDEIGKRPH